MLVVRTACLLTGALLLTACGGGDDPGHAAASASGIDEDAITVTSDSFAEGGKIPPGYTCDGTNSVPPLTWSSVPESARALAIVLSDPDATDGTFYHWIVLDMPATKSGVGLGQTSGGGVVAQNSTGDATYFGPCPPSGSHHYMFTVYALTEPTGLDQGTSTDAALAAIQEHATASGTLVGTYART